MSNIIWVDDISSISESIFSFKHNRKLINEPFTLKRRSIEYNEDSYHLDERDLLIINEKKFIYSVMVLVRSGLLSVN